MKRCPTCKRAFDDDTLSFCLEDGTPLVAEAAARADSQETLVLPRSPVSESSGGAPSAPSYTQLPGKSTVSASPYQNPYATQSGVAKRKVWPWVVAIVVLLLIVIGGVVTVAVIIPGRLQASGNENRPQPTPSRPVSVATPNPSPAANDVPTDSDEVLAQLTKLEKEWTEANIKGDKEALEKILADEYVGNDDSSRTKRRYIDSLKADDSVTDWELSDLTVDQTGERAVVNGRLKEETDDGTQAYDFVDTFVWRDHRWQAAASRATRVKSK
jgi:hypothetical protein